MKGKNEADTRNTKYKKQIFWKILMKRREVPDECGDTKFERLYYTHKLTYTE